MYSSDWYIALKLFFKHFFTPEILIFLTCHVSQIKTTVTQNFSINFWFTIDSGVII